jgi:putative addiction module component (TIGR02574 family)
LLQTAEHDKEAGMTATALMREALALPIQERVALTQALWASIDDQWADADVSEAVAEARRRDAEMDESPSSRLSHDEVMRSARRALG